MKVSHHQLRRHIISMVEGVQYSGGYAVWTCHVISTVEGVQYRTTKTAQGIDGGCICLAK